MAGLADLLEAYKNYRGVQDWKLGQQMNRVPGAEEAMDLWGGWDTGGLAGAIKAYHGSPRAEPFTHFSSEFMGSGEGAQAFGKGHYVAERPGIAKAYAQMRGPMYERNYEFDPAKIEGKLFVPDKKLIQQILKKKDPIDFINERIKILEEDIAWRNKVGDPHGAKLATDNLNRLNKIFPGIVQIGETKGPLRSLYEVSLEWPGARESVDPMSREHFYQWDKEFRSQPKNIREALMDIAEQHPAIIEPYAEWLAKHNSPGHTPETLMKMHPQATIKFLEGGVEPLMYERGIPGIAFLDQPSRTKKVGDRTYNYVAFGDEIPRIISHNKPSVLDMLWPKK